MEENKEVLLIGKEIVAEISGGNIKDKLFRTCYLQRLRQYLIQTISNPDHD